MNKIIPYGYIRVSSLEQARKSSGLDTQDEEVKRYIIQNSETFDIDRIVMMSDAGLSAYAGTNISEGKLGKFIADVKAGLVPEGSALVCYSLDRLSRQNPWIGNQLISTLIGAGIDIHSVAEKMILRSEDPIGAIMSTIYMMRSNNESVIKSERAKSGYVRRLRESIKNKKILTRQMPRWLYEHEGSYAVDLDMRHIIDFIFDSYISGKSTGYIASELNKKGWLYGDTQWRGSYVARLIRDERLIGKHIRYSKQVKGTRREVIEIINDFYPLAVDVEKFHLANNMLTNVAENIRGRTRITYGDTSILRNIFSNVIKCGLCGGDTSVLQNTRVKMVDGERKYIPYKTFLRCRNKSELKKCKQRDVKYELIESVILLHLMGLNIASLLASPIDNQVELYRTELESYIADKVQYNAMIEERKREGKRIRPNTIDALEEVEDRIDELNRLIENHVDENFVPDFNIDLEKITDISNVTDRSLLKKGIATIAKKILYKRVGDYIIIEIIYRNTNAKHVLVVDNKLLITIVNFSIQYNEKNTLYKCNSFIICHEKESNVFIIEGCADIQDYGNMMNFIDYVSDEETINLKDYLVNNAHKISFSTN
ncbi:recombinase family protein [Rouxiella badensis]|uniref:recombinase family protein n=1 Tax=Rouxiella badensis TaxID=1646377 RepID=UPI0022AA1390|nr:recombinase family protein [Rouxiella badensis]WAT08855.1 recombinase family protein [Rouxiella badensis]